MPRAPEEPPAGQVELFPALQAVEHVERQRRPKSQGAAWCPSCPTAAAATGSLVSGGHLVYREHTKTTWSGARVTCPCSGVRLCESAPLDRRDGKRTMCSCQARR